MRVLFPGERESIGVSWIAFAAGGANGAHVKSWVVHSAKMVVVVVLVFLL